MDAGFAERGPGPFPFDPADSAALARARTRVLERIAHACHRSGRDASEVQLIAVSKTVPAERLRAAVAAGLETLGENRVQEALAKVGEVPGAKWHLIGSLQSNKARRAVEAFAMIQTVDGVDLARRLDRLASEVRPDRPLPVLLQVNVDDDPAKAGFRTDALSTALPEVLGLTHLDVRGLMTVGWFGSEPEHARPTFVALRRLAERLKAAQPTLGGQLSMGMSDDFEIAVEEGATIVRVGRALFGARPSGGG